LNKTDAIRILVVDDHPAFRAGLAALVHSQPGLAVVAEAKDGFDAIEQFRRHQPDITLMDLRLPGMSGVEAILAIRKEFADARFIVITTYDGDEDIHRAMQSGAKSYLLKDMSREDIVRTIRAVHAGETLLPAAVASRLAERGQRQELSRPELAVLEQLTRGRGNKEIAAALKLPEDAVKLHLRALFAKLGVRDRTGAALAAIRHGIVRLE
jgi:two-component system NarL family response regulator